MDHSIAEPIDLTDVRAYLCMEPDDQGEDPALTESIAYCRDRLEALLPYYLAEREVRVERDLRPGMRSCVVELRGPVLDIETVELVTAGGTVVTVPLVCYWMHKDRLHVNIEAALVHPERRVYHRGCPDLGILQDVDEDGEVIPSPRDCPCKPRPHRRARRPATVRGPVVGITVEYRAGGHCPPVVKNALLMMVRNRYERRDEDPLTDAVRASVYAETRPNI